MSALSRRTFCAVGVGATALAAQTSKPADAQKPVHRSLLQTRFPESKFAAALVSRDEWKPYARAEDRVAWESLPQEIKAALIGAGEKAMSGDWPIPPATLFLDFTRTGNRARYEHALSARRARLKSLVLAECVEAKGRFAGAIADGVWSTCEETFWGYPAHLGLQRSGGGLPDVSEPVIDLFAAEAAALLAWVDYLVAPQLDSVHNKIRQRIAFEMNRRILSPYLQRDDFWWMGLDPKNGNRSMNNWNPWINSNCLACTLLMELDAARRARIAYKIIRSLDRFLDSYGEDGGCDEGPGYWSRAGGSLFDSLELLRSATSGAVDLYDVPLIQNIGRYIYRVNVAEDWYVNFADASARIHIDGPLVLRYGQHIRDENMQQLGAWAIRDADARARIDTIGRTLPALFNTDAGTTPARQPLVRDAWFADTEVMIARVEGGTTRGVYLAAQGGHNGESHNHNDVGNFIVYADGKPAIIDVGVGTYTAKTFSPQRYEIWTMQSAFHNCPTINGVMQAAGRQYAARDVSYTANNQTAVMLLDIAGAYPPRAGVAAWRRRLVLDRAENEVFLEDTYAFTNEANVVEWTFMAATEPKQAARGQITMDALDLLYDGTRLTPKIETIKIDDARLQSVWGERLFRILLRGSDIPASGGMRFKFVQS